MVKLSEQQQKLLDLCEPRIVVYGDGSIGVHGVIVVGNEYRTALSLERMGLVTVRGALGGFCGWVTVKSADPHPWRVEVIDRDDHELIALRDGERLDSPEWRTFWDPKTERLVYDPRKEFSAS